MRFKTDENVAPDVAALLRWKGHDVATVADQNMRGACDAVLAEICRRESRALLTLDLDFADIRAYPPGDYAGLIVFRLGSQSRSSLVGVATRLMPLLDRVPVEGRLWIVDERGVRVHGEDV
jgi:predicted nuclease of predicted toxin-antitoxin system